MPPVRRATRRRRLIAAIPAITLLWSSAGRVGAAGVVLPPGFSQQVYVTGQGFDRAQQGAAGVPVTTTLGFDATGRLYLAKSGNRYGTVQSEELLLSRLYRIPPGGARLTPATEARYLHGPPLRNPEVGAVGPRGDIFLTTYDPERELGAVYRMRDGRPTLFAGGTPSGGGPPLFKQPEGVAVDASGHVYVADRGRDGLVKLDPAGTPVEALWLGLRVPRARMLALEPGGALWVAGDGGAAAPWQEGTGQIWRAEPDGRARLVFEGPHAAAIAVGPGGALFVADRHAARLYLLAADGRRTEFAAFQDGATPRAIAFAPLTAEARQGGIAGELFVVTFFPPTWYINEVVRISGPFAEFVLRWKR